MFCKFAHLIIDDIMQHNLCFSIWQALMTQGKDLFVLPLKTTWKGKKLLDVEDEIQTIIGYFIFCTNYFNIISVFFPSCSFLGEIISISIQMACIKKKGATYCKKIKIKIYLNVNIRKKMPFSNQLIFDYISSSTLFQPHNNIYLF